jgi:hypothetical protein
LAHSCADAHRLIEVDTAYTIIDSTLPDGDGLALFRELRGRCPRLRCILLILTPAATPALPPDCGCSYVRKADGLLSIRIALTKLIAGSAHSELARPARHEPAQPSESSRPPVVPEHSHQ